MDIPGQIICYIIVIFISILDVDLTEISFGDQGKGYDFVEPSVCSQYCQNFLPTPVTLSTTDLTDYSPVHTDR